MLSRLTTVPFHVLNTPEKNCIFYFDLFFHYNILVDIVTLTDICYIAVVLYFTKLTVAGVHIAKFVFLSVDFYYFSFSRNA